MAWTQSKTKQVTSRLLAGHIMEILGKRGLLFKIIPLGLKDWNGVKTPVQKLDNMTLDEQSELEQEILEQVKLMI